MDVDAVKQWTRDTRPVALQLLRRALADMLQVGGIPTRTSVQIPGLHFPSPFNCHPDVNLTPERSLINSIP
jgi:hypothetical protein